MLGKFGKYFADFNFRGSRPSAKSHENWKTRKFFVLRYVIHKVLSGKDIILTGFFRSAYVLDHSSSSSSINSPNQGTPSLEVDHTANVS